MATCKDCLHYEICADFRRNICEHDRQRFEEYKINPDGLCDNFKNKADVIVPPCKVGDTVYCIIAKGGFCGGLIYTGHIVARKVDKLIYDGSRWEMMSDRVYPDYKDGNCLIYAYFDDLAFVSEEKANERLNEILDVGRKHTTALAERSKG